MGIMAVRTFYKRLQYKRCTEWTRWPDVYVALVEVQNYTPVKVKYSSNILGENEILKCQVSPFSTNVLLKTYVLQLPSYVLLLTTYVLLLTFY